MNQCFGFILVIFAFLSVSMVQPCDEILCRSVVSRCQITEACRCKTKNCACLQSCRKCLGSLYNECCYCLDMCRNHINTQKTSTRISHVRSLNDTVLTLFKALTEEEGPDPLDTWITYINENCNVAFSNNCMSRTQCRKLCGSMGAGSFRWFLNGCCECVENKCHNYGINDIRCRDCQVQEDNYIPHCELDR